MSRTIWKYEFDLTDEPVIPMPVGAQVLHADIARPTSSDGTPALIALWADVDPNAALVARDFVMRGTGHPLPEVGSHVATFRDGPFVWHLFEAVSR